MNWKTWVIIGAILLTAGLMIGWQMSPRVLEVLPAVGEIRGRQPLQILFSRPMDAQSIEENLVISPPLDGEFHWNEDFSGLTFTPRKIWPPGETVSVQLVNNARSKIKFPLLRKIESAWAVSPISLVYLYPADESSNLYQINPESGESQLLTTHPGGVLAYSISFNNESILYSIAAENGASQILALDRQSNQTTLIRDCQHSLCTTPHLSPDGNLLAYEYITYEGSLLPGIRVYNLRDQSVIDLGNPDEHLERPLWSTSGWLAYYNQTHKVYEFWNPITNTTQFLPNETGGDGSWSADGRYFLTSEILFAGETLAPRHLQLYDLIAETTQDLSEGDYLEDLNPSFSTQGRQFAFSRKSLTPQDWTPGRQLWVMNLESGDSIPLTDEIDYQHTSFIWHPDGNRLAYVRYNQASLSEAPEIWIINTTNREALRLIINGFAPGWIP